jgi:transcription termination factor NusB
LETVQWEKQVQKFESGIHNRPDGRTKVIFENGTSSNMMFQSLYKALHFRGKAITENADSTNEEFYENLSEITNEDKEAGYIYVLSSKSTDPKIREIRNLFKIGYSTTPVANRIKNAEKEPTYLMAPVHIEAEYKTFNMNTQKFEQLLHNFFGSSCLNIDIYDEKLRRHMPQEWFIAPLQVIDQAIEMIITEEIIHYKFDKELEEIVLKS